MTELRRKMLEELQLRNYSPNTQRAYIRCVADFAKHFEAAPDRLGCPVLTGAEASIYGTLATIFGSLLGFILTSISIIISLGDSPRLAVIRQSGSNQQLWKIFTSATKWLAV